MVVIMLHTKYGGGGVSAGHTILKSNVSRERIKVGHGHACFSRMS